MRDWSHVTALKAWGLFCWKCVRVKAYIHAQCVNWSAGISNPHSRACPSISSFLLGFTYCDDSEREIDRNIIFRCSFIGYFYLGFHIVTTGKAFLCLTMIQKRKNIAPTHKSDSLVFRCSVYYLIKLVVISCGFSRKSSDVLLKHV
jgi:hypothetical protein